MAVAGAVLRDSYASSHRWYEEFAELLGGPARRSTRPRPTTRPCTTCYATRSATPGTGAAATELRPTLQMLWADEMLETQRQIQDDLAGSAALFAQGRHGRFSV